MFTTCVVSHLVLVVRTEMAALFSLNTTAAVHVVPSYFLSVTMDGGATNTATWQSEELASALSPAYIRFGGNSASTRVYQGFGDRIDGERDTDVTAPYPPPENVNSSVLTAAQFDELAAFSKRVGWSMVFDLNACRCCGGRTHGVGRT